MHGTDGEGAGSSTVAHEHERMSESRCTPYLTAAYSRRWHVAASSEQTSSSHLLLPPRRLVDSWGAVTFNPRILEL